MARVQGLYLKILCPFLLFLLPSFIWGQTGTQPRQVEAVDTISTGDTLATYEDYIMVSELDTIGIDDYRYHHRRLAHELFIKDDSVCYQLLESGDTVCVKIDTIQVIYGDPTDTSYYFQVQVNGGTIDSITHMELIQINNGTGINVTYNGTAITIASTVTDTDTYIDSVRQITAGVLDSIWLYKNDLSDSLLIVLNDSVIPDTDTDTYIDSIRHVNDGVLDSIWFYRSDMSDSLLLVLNDSVGAGGTDDQQITQFEISNDTIYLTLEDGGGQMFLVIEHPDTCFHSVEAITDSSFHILDCNGTPLDTVALPGPTTDYHWFNRDLTLNRNRVHNGNGYNFTVSGGGAYSHSWSSISLDATGSDVSIDAARDISTIATRNNLYESGQGTYFMGGEDGVFFSSDSAHYYFDRFPGGFGNFVEESLPPINDTLQYAIVVDTALGRWYLRDMTTVETVDTYIDSAAYNNVIDTLTLYRDSSGVKIDSFKVLIETDTFRLDYDSTTALLSYSGQLDSPLVVLPWKDAGADDYSANYFKDSIRHDGYVGVWTVPEVPLHVLDPSYPTPGADTFETVVAIFEQGLSGASSQVVLRNGGGVNWNVISHAGSRFMVSYEDEGVAKFQIDTGAQQLALWIKPDDEGIQMQDYGQGILQDTFSYIAGWKADGDLVEISLTDLLDSLNQDSTVHRDFDFILLPLNDTLGTNIDSLNPDDSTDLYALIWHGGQVRIGETPYQIRYDTTQGGVDATAALQIIGQNDAIDIYHDSLPTIWIRNNKGDAQIRFSDNEMEHDTTPSFLEFGFINWQDTATMGTMGDTTLRHPFRVSSHANTGALEVYQDSILLGDYIEADTTITSTDLLGSGIFISKDNGKLRLVTPDTLNALLNVVASAPQEIDTFALNNDSLVLDLTNTTGGLKYVDFSKYNNSNITISNDSLFVGDSVLILPQGADSSGVTIPDGEIYVGTGTRGATSFSTLNSTENVINLPGDIRTGSGANAVALRIGKNRTSDGSAQFDLFATGSPGFGDFGTRMFRASGANGGFNYQNSGTGNINFYTQGATNLNAVFAGDGDVYLTPTSGDVGIGTNTPTAQLHVDGDVQLENLSSGTLNQMVWADANGKLGFVAPSTFDDYNNWNLQASGGSTTQITSNETVTFAAGSGLTVSRGANTITYTSLWQRTNASRVELDNADTLYFGNSHRLELDGGIIDYNGTRGSSGQVLRTTGSDVYWGDLPDASSSNELQTLSWNSGSNELTISSGNTVDLSSLAGGGSDGDGIYDGNGNVTGSTVASITGGSSFAFNYNGSNQELTISSSGTFLRSNQGTSSNAVELDLSGVTIEALGTDDDVSIVAERDVIITSGSGSSDQVIINAEGGLVATFDGTDTRINSNIQIGDNVDDQLEIISSAGSHVQIQHEDIASDAAYIRFFDNGNIGIIGNGSFVSIDAGSSSSSEVIIDGNIQLGTLGSNGSRVITISNGTVPTTSPSNAVQIYSQDVSSSAELRTRDEAGNITTLSPHNFSKIPEGPSEEMAWSYYSERDGKYINVDMLKLARLVEELTGEKLVYTNSK